MTTVHEVLSAMAGMQADTQAAMPVIPNNGNPRSIYNTPAAQQPQAAPAPVARPRQTYEWLQPSPAMAQINSMLQRRAGVAEPMAPQPQVMPMAQQPVIPRRVF